MPCLFRVPLLAAWLGMSALIPSGAAEPTFAELLDRATAQAEAGRQWGPPGDNVTDTFLAMSKMLSTATPQQLAAFEALLHKEQEALAHEAEPPQAGPSAAAPADADLAPPPNPPPPGPPLPGPPPPGRVAVAPAVLPSLAAADLFARGRQAEARGDVSAARRLYASAAQDGHAAAARALSQLYDPGYLRQHTVGGIDADAGLARYWNDRANDLSRGSTAAIPEARLAR